MSVAAVEVTRLGVSRGGVPILREVSMSVADGEMVALLGGNGSGKTTLVRTMLGLVPVSTGTVELYGTPLDRFREWSRLGYVPQRASINLHATTVTELVTSGTLSHRRPFAPLSRADKAKVAETIELVGLGGRADEPYVHLSGGQQQRVLIARALVSDPELLVMDEPFAGVDLRTQESLADVLRERHQAGLAILVVLHEPGPLAPMVERAVVLRDGRVVHDGPPEGLTSHEHDHHHEERPGLVEGVTAWTS